MSVQRALFYTIKADFLERVRSYGFIVVLLLTLLAAYVFVPSPDAGYMTLKLASPGDSSYFRGEYNSAWIGIMVALLTTLFLSLFGFFLVKNAINRDRTTGVGQIIATTPVSKPLYLFGKAISNFTVLAVIVGVMMIGALAMQILHSGGTPVDLWNLWAPFIFLSLPAMAVVSSVAVLFESISLLRGGLGNVAYVFLYLFVLVALLTAVDNAAPGSNSAYLTDLFGTGVGIAGIKAAAQAAYPSLGPWGWSLGFAGISGPLHIFTWNGVSWTPVIILGRLFWVLVACLIAMIGSVFFDRFDSAVNAGKKAKKAVPVEETERAVETATMQIRLTSLASGQHKPNPGSLFIAELRLALKGQRWWWHVGALIIIAAGLFASDSEMRHFVTIAAIVWPVLIWSSMSVREHTYNTGQIVFSAPGPIKNQLPVTWLAGVIVGFAVCSGVLVSMAMSGSYIEMSTLAVEMLMVPAMALAMGIWSGSSKLFEALYMILWYVGPVNNMPFLDLTGSLFEAMHLALPVAYLAITLILLSASVIGRHRQAEV
jgi:hypothetical protein